MVVRYFRDNVQVPAPVRRILPPHKDGRRTVRQRTYSTCRLRILLAFDLLLFRSIWNELLKPLCIFLLAIQYMSVFSVRMK
jgi:hypothetical protein